MVNLIASPSRWSYVSSGGLDMTAGEGFGGEYGDGHITLKSPHGKCVRFKTKFLAAGVGAGLPANVVWSPLPSVGGVWRWHSVHRELTEQDFIGCFVIFTGGGGAVIGGYGCCMLAGIPWFVLERYGIDSDLGEVIFHVWQRTKAVICMAGEDLGIQVQLGASQGLGFLYTSSNIFSDLSGWFERNPT